MSYSFPSNVHISQHPVLKTKISAIRQNVSAKTTRSLTSEISSILAVWVAGDAFKTTLGTKVCIYINILIL